MRNLIFTAVQLTANQIASEAAFSLQNYFYKIQAKHKGKFRDSRLDYNYKATFTDLRNLSTFSLACLFYFTVHRCTMLFGPKVK